MGNLPALKETVWAILQHREWTVDDSVGNQRALTVKVWAATGAPCTVKVDPLSLCELWVANQFVLSMGKKVSEVKPPGPCGTPAKATVGKAPPKQQRQPDGVKCPQWSDIEILVLSPTGPLPLTLTLTPDPLTSYHSHPPWTKPPPTPHVTSRPRARVCDLRSSVRVVAGCILCWCGRQRGQVRHPTYLP